MPAINIQAVIAKVEQAEEAALEEVADYIVRDAKARAPVRKVFREPKGFRRKFRSLTAPERNLAIKRAMAHQGYSDWGRRVSVAYLQGRIQGRHGRYVGAEIKRPSSNNSLAKSRTLRILGTQEGRTFTPRVDARRVPSRRSGTLGYESAVLHPLLTARGRYEVRSGRAIHQEVLASGAVRVHIGGRLKASIGSEGAVQTGNGTTVRVTAGVRYAKFVEFPTTHNASQPFLLPALHDNRSRLKSVLAREIKSRLGG